MDYRILGPLEVETDSGLVRVRRRERALLSVLLLFAGWPCSTGMLTRALWAEGDLPVSPQGALRVCVSRLRRALGQAGCLTTLEGGYRADPPPGRTDLGRFRNLHSRAQNAAALGDLRLAAGVLEQALACWRHPPLADLPSSPEIAAEAACLLEQRRLTELDLADLRLDLGDHERIVADLHARVIADPLRERGWAQLMLALHRCGRRGEALAAFSKAKAALAAEYGTQPGRDLQEALRAVLDDEAAARPRFRGLTAGITSARPVPVAVGRGAVSSPSLAGSLLRPGRHSPAWAILPGPRGGALLS